MLGKFYFHAIDFCHTTTPTTPEASSFVNYLRCLQSARYSILFQVKTRWRCYLMRGFVNNSNIRWIFPTGGLFTGKKPLKVRETIRREMRTPLKCQESWQCLFTWIYVSKQLRDQFYVFSNEQKNNWINGNLAASFVFIFPEDVHKCFNARFW